MRLNTIRPSAGARPTGKRAGRGVGSGVGKTGGRGHKGQRSRSGGYHKMGFEGGQMPVQRRLPKFGFHAHRSRWNDEVRLGDLARVSGDVIDLATLKSAKLVDRQARRVKILRAGQIDRAVTVRGVKVTRGAREAIEAAGGTIE